MRLLLDTTAVSCLLDAELAGTNPNLDRKQRERHERALRLREALEQHEFFISAVGWGETLAGIEMTDPETTPGRRLRRRLQLMVQRIVPTTVLNYTESTADAWAVLRAGGLEKNLDGLIIATALDYDIDAVVTDNKHHFEGRGVVVFSVDEAISLPRPS